MRLYRKDLWFSIMGLKYWVIMDFVEKNGRLGRGEIVGVY